MQRFSLSQHPPALKAWLFSEFAERLCFFSVRALLTIIMIRSLNMSEEQAVLTIAMFTSYCYLTPLIGGLIADRFIPYEYATILGSTLITIGYFVIGLPSDHDLFLGLSFVITGMGFYKTNLITCVSQLYTPENELKRNEAFTIFYAIVDFSLLIATGLLGWLAQYSWHWTFIGLAGLSFLSLLNLAHFLSQAQHIIQFKKLLSLRNLVIAIFITLQIITFNILLTQSKTSHPVLWSVFGLALLYCAWTAYCCSPQDRKNILIILFFSMISIILLAFIEQLGYAILLYIEHHVDRTVMGHNIPAPFFITLEPLGFILLLPLISYLISLWKNTPSIIVKFILAFLFAALAFFILAMMTYPQSSEGNYYSIALAIFILTASEIIVLPSILSLTTRLAPKAITSVTVGLSFMSLAFATSLAGQIFKSSLVTITIDGIPHSMHNYFNLFWGIAVSSLVMVFFLVIFVLPTAKKFKWGV